MKKYIKNGFLALAILFFCFFSLQNRCVQAAAVSESEDFEQLSVFISTRQTPLADANLNKFSNTDESYLVEKPQLIDKENRIFYVNMAGSDVQERSTSPFTCFRISGLLKSASKDANVTLKNWVDPEGKKGQALGIEKNKCYYWDESEKKVKSETDNVAAFLQKEPTLTDASDVVAVGRGISVYELRVEKADKEPVIYYLMMDSNSRTSVETPYASLNNIMLYDGSTQNELEEKYQFFKNRENGLIGMEQGSLNKSLITLPGDIKSIRISADVYKKTTNFTYYPKNDWDQLAFYMIQSLTITANGEKSIESFIGEKSEEIVLKKGLNIIQVNTHAPGFYTKPYNGNKLGPMSAVNTLLIYREGENDYQPQKSTSLSTELHSLKVYRASKKPKDKNFGELYNSETGNTKGIELFSGSPYIFVAALPEDLNAKVNIAGATPVDGGFNVQLNHLDNDYLAIEVTPSDGDEDKTYIHHIPIIWTVTAAELADIEISGASMKPEQFSKDKTTYTIIPDADAEQIVITPTLTERTTIEVLADRQKIPKQEGSYMISLPIHRVEIWVTASDKTQKEYVFTLPRNDTGISAETKNEAVGILNKALPGYMRQLKSSSAVNYWKTFDMSAAGDLLTEDDINGSYAYDVTSHTYKQATDYAAVILELVMLGENPYDFLGKNYVELLLKEDEKVDTEVNGFYGMYANNIWALWALDAAGYDYGGKDALVGIVLGQAASRKGDLDMRGWALAAVRNHLGSSGVTQEKVNEIIDSMKDRQKADGPKASVFDHIDYKNCNLNTHSCVISGLAAWGVDMGADEWKVGENTPVSVLHQWQAEDGTFGIQGQYNKDVMIALGDIYNESNVFSRQALTEDKYASLVASAKEQLEKMKDTDKSYGTLSEAYEEAKKYVSSGNTISSHGEAYYALYEILQDVEGTKLDIFMGTPAEREEVRNLVQAIDNLCEGGVTYRDIEAINGLKADYEDLLRVRISGKEESALLQHYVKNDYKLDLAQPVAELSQRIHGLGDINTLGQEKVEEAQGILAVYEDMAEDEKAYVAEADLTSLKAIENKLTAMEVEVKIAAIPDTVSAAAADTVKAAQEAYDALTEEQKNLVLPELVLRLKEAQEALRKGQEEDQANAQKEKDEAAAAAVAEKVKALGDSPTEAQIKEALAAYNALTEEQKALLGDDIVYKLKEAEKALGVVLSEIKLDKTTLQMVQNETVYLTATVTPGSNADGTVTWTSSDPKVADVDNKGMVTSFKDGTVVITAATSDGVTATCTVIVDSKLALKVKQTTNSVTLTWKSVPGAKGYVIQRYDTKSKKYKEIASVSSGKTSYTVKRVNGKSGEKLSPGTVYQFQVRAYVEVDGKQVYRQTGTIKTATKPAKAVWKKLAKKSKTKAKLSWKKLNGVDGYQIYMAASKNGKYKLDKTIKKAKTISYTKGGLKKGKTYYFKVRGYKKVGGKTLYGAFSKIGKVKMK